MVIIAVIMFVVGYICSLPFTLTFDQISTQIKITHKHSLPHQMLVLWGFPVFCVMAFIVKVLYDRKMKLPDLCIILFGLCAIGLILLPELIFVLDIYGDVYERANTMFKLTFQACILFGICTGYTIMVLLSELKRLKFIPILCIIFLFIEVTYMKNFSLYGNFLDPKSRKGLDASAYAKTKYINDYDGIKYLDDLQGVHVIVEAVGVAYEETASRVSALTGNQTIIGWQTHEWLWHNDSAVPSERSSDVYQIYTSTDVDKVADLLKQYNVEYIFIGEVENKVYGDEINRELLYELCDEIGHHNDSCLLSVNYDKVQEYIDKEDAKWVQVYQNGEDLNNDFDYSQLPEDWLDDLTKAAEDKKTKIEVDENGETVIQLIP